MARRRRRPQDEKPKLARKLAKRRPTEVASGTAGIVAAAVVQIFGGDSTDTDITAAVTALVGFVPSVMTWFVDTWFTQAATVEEEDQETVDGREFPEAFDGVLEELAETAKNILETARVKETDWEKKADAVNKVAPILEQVRNGRGSRNRRRRRREREEAQKGEMDL